MTNRFMSRTPVNASNEWGVDQDVSVVSGRASLNGPVLFFVA